MFWSIFERPHKIGFTVQTAAFKSGNYGTYQTGDVRTPQLACASVQFCRSPHFFFLLPTPEESIWESPPQFDNRIITRVYVRSITRTTMY